MLLVNTRPGHNCSVACWHNLPCPFAMQACCATGPPLRTVGALDLGGSSLEVTFLPPPGAAISDDADKGAAEASPFPLHSCTAHLLLPASLAGCQLQAGLTVVLGCFCVHHSVS